MTNELPLGADAPTFAMRKRIIMLGLRSKQVKKLLEVVLLLFLLLAFLGMSWATYPTIPWWIYLAIPILAYCTYLWIESLQQIRRLIHIIKSVEPIIDDPTPHQGNQLIQEESDYARLFAKPRLITRLTGVLIAVLTGSLLYYIYSSQPSSLPQIYVLLPFFFMLGISLLIYPISKIENLHRYGAAQMQYKHMPLGLKMCLLIGAVLSVLLLLQDL